MDLSTEFRASIREEFAPAFEFAEKVAWTVGDAVIRHLELNHEEARALDILMQQAWEAHNSVCLLSERNFLHTAQLCTRHLLEQVIQASYITRPQGHDIRRHRARRFLAKLWISVPAEDRAKLLSEPDILQWSNWIEEWKMDLPENTRRWWPSFKELFDEAGASETYKQDYRYLSGVAHGASWLILRDYSGAKVTRYSKAPVWIPLVHASRYCLGVALCWNKIFGQFDSTVLDGLIEEVLDLRERYNTTLHQTPGLAPIRR